MQNSKYKSFSPEKFYYEIDTFRETRNIKLYCGNLALKWTSKNFVDAEIVCSDTTSFNRRVKFFIS